MHTGMGHFFLRARKTLFKKEKTLAPWIWTSCLMGMTQWVRDEYLHCDSDCHGYDAYFAALQQPHITITLHAPVHYTRQLALYRNVQTSAFMWDRDIHTLHADGLHADGLQTYQHEL